MQTANPVYRKSRKSKPPTNRKFSKPCCQNPQIGNQKLRIIILKIEMCTLPGSQYPLLMRVLNHIRMDYTVYQQ